jgi:hypothetical protein
MEKRGCSAFSKNQFRGGQAISLAKIVDLSSPKQLKEWLAAPNGGGGGKIK